MTILTILSACQKNEVSSLSEHVTIHATIEDKDATRTVMDENNNVLWSENDKIIAFMKSSYGYKYQVKPSFVGKSYADFSVVASNNGSDLSAGNEWEHNVVYYPYSEDIECLKSGSNYTLEVNIPSEQIYMPDSFANGSMPMVAVSSNNNITFRNILGGMKLQLKGTQTVTSLKIEGKNNEKLSGAANVTAYTVGTKPTITMAADASASVTLNCGAGVQLKESTATEFIIALPPVLFSKGFTVTVTDSENNTYTVETNKANTVLRSSLLVMPAFKLENNPSDEPGDDELVIPVATVSLNYTSLKLNEGDFAQLTATVKPKDATDQTVVWISDTPSIATVDQTGLVIAVSTGTAKISATAGGIVSTCTITVSFSADYIDEYGVNHGKGTTLGIAIWAPVNCGYHANDFKYGKLYQWGRKYGQGYSGSLYIDITNQGTYTDSSVPTIEEGPVSAITGNHKSKENVFYTSTSEYNYDWVYPQDDELWNSGTESKPVKTDYDPCPEGWRVPTEAELESLCDNEPSWTTNADGQKGYLFSGAKPYTEDVPQVFLPAAGSLGRDTGSANNRGLSSGYWSSRRSYSGGARTLYSTSINGYHRAYGFSVRCVQE